MDLVLRGGTVVQSGGQHRAEIAIRDGKIAAFAAPGTRFRAEEERDVSGRYLLPGVVDVHSHHREPGFTHKEDIITATSACAAGGITTTVAMPNVDPPPNTADRLSTMLDAYAARALVDYNINAAATVLDEIPRMAGMGIGAFKIFMVVDTGRDYPHMPGIGVHDHGQLLAIFEKVGSTGLPLMVHPHDQSLMAHIEQEYWRRGERDCRAYARAYAAHDGLIWDTATAVLLRLQAATNVPLHLLHTQTRGMVEQVRRAKAAGQRVTAEINPWALFLGNDWANIERLGSYALSYWVPEVHVSSLWHALNDGTVDIFSSDHAPHTREEKEVGWTDGWQAHTGTPSAQFYLSLLLDASTKGLIGLERIAEVTSRAPATLLGLADKGRILVGADADIVAVSLDRTTMVSDQVVLSKCGWTPYAGRELRGTVDLTILRGTIIYEDGEVVGRPGAGQQVRPAQALSDTETP